MFDGNDNCVICEGLLENKRRKPWLSLKGHTYVFCESCWQSRKKEIDEILNNR